MMSRRANLCAARAVRTSLDQLGICEHGRLDGREDAFLPLGRLPAMIFCPRMRPVIDDQIDPETAGNLRAWSSCRCRSCHEREHAPPAGEPREYAAEDSDGVHLIGEYTPVSSDDYRAAQLCTGARNRNRSRRSCLSSRARAAATSGSTRWRTPRRRSRPWLPRNSRAMTCHGE